MKLWHSFTKELLLASRSFYFYIEIVMAGIFLFLLIFAIPEKFEGKSNEYLYYDVPASALPLFEDELLKEDEDGLIEIIEFQWNDKSFQAHLYESESNRFYVLDNQEAAIGIANQERAFAGIIHMNEKGQVTYTYYMQGYETERLRNLYAVLHNEDIAIIQTAIDGQEVRQLHANQVLLNDRQNTIPSFLTFNGSLMGMFILASYIFLDKKEGVIKAYAITTSPVWHYLLSKVGVVTITSLITSLIITIPVMGLQPNYGLLILFLLTTGFAASALGLLLSSFYDDIVQSFGVLFILIILMMLPNIAYFIPSWNPIWMQFIPTSALLQGFKEILLPGGDKGFVVIASAGFLFAGLILFFLANSRFKKTLTV